MSELAWLPTGEHGKKELHWRNNSSEPWRHWKMHQDARSRQTAFSAAQLLLTKGFKYVGI